MLSLSYARFPHRIQLIAVGVPAGGHFVDYLTRHLSERLGLSKADNCINLICIPALYLMTFF